MTPGQAHDDRERTEILETLTKHRGFLRHTVHGLTDDQAAAHPTVSALCLGGLIKHVSAVEEHWVDFIEHGDSSSGPPDASAMEAHAATFRMEPGDTLARLLADYDAVAARTEKVVGALDSLDDAHPLPPAPWFEKGAQWSARRVLLHIIAETSQHAGHADMIRESIDGAKTMG